ncbi:hypothetical protein BU26DRAFT_88710 [Trematosphaeria pertusa]|uniref:Uncharacterized protein n=1 Tax=Trematosphaeria pertusa TaxID=390896 RepID=A0A6A6I4E4_9PLEO|nr:uncharacterized protein BU26DRAFT_88710 [Trematosphaeria pertusa]KAF2244888.1 hypothetical protein BU26DRAFT_88710 [Trematosphaeria pertusa]
MVNVVCSPGVRRRSQINRDVYSSSCIRVTSKVQELNQRRAQTQTQTQIRNRLMTPSPLHPRPRTKPPKLSASTAIPMPPSWPSPSLSHAAQPLRSLRSAACPLMSQDLSGTKRSQLEARGRSRDADIRAQAWRSGWADESVRLVEPLGWLGRAACGLAAKSGAGFAVLDLLGGNCRVIERWMEGAKRFASAAAVVCVMLLALGSLSVFHGCE